MEPSPLQESYAPAAAKILHILAGLTPISSAISLVVIPYGKTGDARGCCYGLFSLEFAGEMKSLRRRSVIWPSSASAASK